jgi:hypothetical protein
MSKLLMPSSQASHCGAPYIYPSIHPHSFHSSLPNPLITNTKNFSVMFYRNKKPKLDDDVKILVLYVDIRIVCPAKTYSQLSNANSQCSGKMNEN